MTTAYDVILQKCHICDKKMGIAMMISNGSPHQYINATTCYDCIPEAIEQARGRGVAEEDLQTAREAMEND